MKKIKQTMIAIALNLSMFSFAFGFDTTFGSPCDTYECWILQVWTWAMTILIPLSVLILSAAGVIYMTSEGDSNRVSIAKKLIIGVFSGVGLLILARVLLGVIGIEGMSWNV